MGFWTLFAVASMPVLKVLLISGLGAFLATRYMNVLTADARKHINNIVFIVFTPAIMFASLAKSVTLDNLISWWYMPVNILLTFLIGGLLGWILVKIAKPPSHLRGLVVGNCAAGNVGNLLLILIPAICQEKGSPFGDPGVCNDYGIAYASFSMAIGAIYIWTFVYNIVRSSSIQRDEAAEIASGMDERIPVKDYSDAGLHSSLLQIVDTEMPTSTPKNGSAKDCEHSMVVAASESINEEDGKGNFVDRQLKKFGIAIHLKEIMAPPTIGAVVGFVIGAIPQAKGLFVGQNAPLKVIQDSISLLGDGTIPSITLILGGNLTKGLRSSEIKLPIVVGIILVRFLILPLIGLFIVKGASYLGMVQPDPLYQFILLIQFALPPAMSIGTMTQLFGVGESECSVIFLWTYLLAAIAITMWSIIFMWLLI